MRCVGAASPGRRRIGLRYWGRRGIVPPVLQGFCHVRLGGSISFASRIGRGDGESGRRGESHRPVTPPPRQELRDEKEPAQTIVKRSGGTRFLSSASAFSFVMDRTRAGKRSR